MQKQTLGLHIEKFSSKEQMIICFALNVAGGQGVTVHRGVLPFVKADDAITALDVWTSGKSAMSVGAASHNVTWRSAKMLHNKLVRLYGTSIAFKMYLNDGKVAKRFGPHPERGIPLKGHLKKVSAGLRWSVAHRGYVVDDNVLVNPMLVLRKRPDRLWDVIVDKQYRSEVERWLLDYCG